MPDVKKLIELFEAKAKQKPRGRLVKVPPLEKPGSGRALPPEVRAAAEQAFDADFSKVRIHEDRSVTALAADVGAKAYVSGHNIYFAPGGSKDNKLLAHELAHIAQARGGARNGHGTI
jgi:uncharacterized protein DUF4157